MIYLNWNYHFRGEDDGAMGSSFFWEHNGNDTLLWSHPKVMYQMAKKTFPEILLINPFYF